MLGICCQAAKDYERSRATFAGALADPKTPAAMKPMALNGLVWSRLLTGERAESLEEAERCSAEALRLMPWDINIKDTRGCVLVELGRVAEGVAMLSEAAAELPSRLQAWPLSYLALAAAREGRPHEYHDYLAQARHLDPECPVLEAVERKAGPWLAR
jgi:Tfp pilus assembly protein PilF